jgi:2-hydroxy-3-oxopropionate reductase
MDIGFIGLGAMGRPMAVNLVDAGYGLVVCDTDESKTAILAQRGATVARTAKEVADGADFVLACTARS